MQITMNASRYQKISDLAERQLSIVEKMVKTSEEEGAEKDTKLYTLAQQSAKLIKLLSFTERE